MAITAVESAIKKFPITMQGPGVVKNVVPYLIPNNSFQDVNNAKFLTGILSKVLGWQKFATGQLAGTAIMNIDQFFLSSGSDFLMVTTATTIYKWDGTSTFVSLNGTALTGDLTFPIFTDTGFDLFVVANGKDTIKKWDGSAATFSALGGLTDVELLDGVAPIIINTANAIKFFKNFLVLLAPTENGTLKPSRLRTSRLGLPENWKNDASGNGQAFAADIGTVDYILNGERLRNSFVIYKERSIWLMDYVGLPLIWSFREVVSGIGPVGPKAIGVLGDEHIFVANDDIYFFNGDTIDTVGDPVRKYFFQNANPKYIQRTEVFVMEEDNEALIGFPSTASSDGSLDKALVFNYVEKTWTIRDLNSHTSFGYYRRTTDLIWSADLGTWDNPTYPGTWDERVFLDSSPLNLMGDINRYVYVLQGGNQDTAAINMTATTKLYDLGESTAYKRIQRIYLLLKQGGNYNFSFDIGRSDNMDDNPVYTGPYNFNVSDTSNAYIDVDVYGRFFTFRITQNAADQNIEIVGFVVYYILKSDRKTK